MTLAHLIKERDDLYRQIKEGGEQKLPADPSLIKKVRQIEKEIKAHKG